MIPRTQNKAGAVVLTLLIVTWTLTGAVPLLSQSVSAHPGTAADQSTADTGQLERPATRAQDTGLERPDSETGDQLRGVVGEPQFTVTIESTTSPVREGEELEVVANVRNVGGGLGTQTIDFSVGDQATQSESAQLHSGESRTVRFSWVTEEGDAGEYTATVETPDDSASSDVRVTTPAEFAVEATSTNSPVVAGERVAVTASVNNLGTESGDQTIALSVDDTVRDEQDVSLGGSESATVSLSWETQDGDAGEYTATVESENQSSTANVVVEEPEPIVIPFAVSVESTSSSVTEGETVEVTANVTNEGEAPVTEELTLRVGESVRDSREVELQGGESQSVTFSWETTAGDAGEYTAVIAGEANQSSTRISIDQAESSTFAVTIDNVSRAPESQGEFMVNATIENTGETEDTQTVTVTSEDQVRSSQNITLASGESRPVTFTWEQERQEELTVVVASETDRDRSSTVLQGQEENEEGVVGPVSTTQLAGIVLLVPLLGGFYYYARRRQQSLGDTPSRDDGMPEETGDESPSVNEPNQPTQPPSNTDQPTQPPNDGSARADETTQQHDES